MQDGTFVEIGNTIWYFRKITPDKMFDWGENMPLLSPWMFAKMQLLSKLSQNSQ